MKVANQNMKVLETIMKRAAALKEVSIYERYNPVDRAVLDELEDALDNALCAIEEIFRWEARQEAKQ